MKRALILLALLILIFPLASAEIVITQPPKDIYNLGDIVTIPSTIRSVTSLTGTFEMFLLCGAQEINFYRNGISLESGDEKKVEASLVLNKLIINETKGDCKIKATLGGDFVLTEVFKISDLILIDTNYSQTEFSPGENLLVKGHAIKENRQNSNGYIGLEIVQGNSSILTQQETINNGFFSINVTLPDEMAAGEYNVKLRAYEEDISNQLTNVGFHDQGIYIKQIPTSLEVFFENSEIEPGTSVKVKGILHDQTGEKIESLTFLTLKNEKDKIIEQIEIATDEFFEHEIAYNEAPGIWKVVAVSNKITSESTFGIKEKEDAKVEIVNTTIFITNIGNVPYNETVLVKIGETPLNIEAYLEVDESQRYLLSAPDGEYEVSIIADGERTNATLPLTGNAIDIKKASTGVISLVKFPLVWIFVLLILGFITFLVFKRGYQKSFFGYIGSKMKDSKKEDVVKTGPDPQVGSNAELALSIKGDKQDASVIALKVRNMASLKHSKEGSANEVLSKIKELTENSKAAVYQSHDTLFFILAPVRTKTFRNEMHALKIAQKIKAHLDEHNRTFQQKVNYGIALTRGPIIAKQEKHSFKFMAMGNLVTQSKKISALSEGKILLSEEITDKIRTEVKPERHTKSGMHVYSIKEIKNREEHEKFLKGFMKRQEKDKKK
jgi:hypothetical protein